MRVIVIDNDQRVRAEVASEFEGSGHEVFVAENSDEGLAFVDGHDPDVVLLDMGLPGAGGLATFHQIRAIDARVPVIIMTARGTSELAIGAIKVGAFDYFEKPLDLIALRRSVARAVEVQRQMREPVVLPEEEPARGTADRLIGSSPAMQEVYKTIGRVAGLPVTILIRGESGTGKELVARAVYANSQRSDKPYLAVNCAAIPDQLLESDLFGHERGSFTGADCQKIGKFEQYSGGTLFLDEIGDMAPALQAKILRVLQDKTFQRIGGNEMIQSDVRIIAATNIDIEEAVRNSRFRKDLYYRLNGVTIELPPLRDRTIDISILVVHFLERFRAEFGKDVRRVADDTMARLQTYSWPGNVRELQNVVRHALIRTQGPILRLEDLPLTIWRLSDDVQAPAGAAWAFDRFVDERLASAEDGLYHAAIRELERRLIIRVLNHTKGNQLQAAQRLGLARNTLRAKIREHGIVIKRAIER